VDCLGDLKHKKIKGLYVDVRGQGAPIIFLHGGPGSEHHFFLPHVLPLLDSFQLVFYDQRGCGRSDPSSNNKYSIEDEIDNLESIRKELDLEKINLFGESWGTMLALSYAITYPERVNKIFLTAAIGIKGDNLHMFESELMARLTEDDQKKLEALDKSTHNHEIDASKLFTILDKYYVYSLDTLDKKGESEINMQVNQKLGEDIELNYDLTDKLDAITHIPILVAQGSHDLITPKLIQSLLINYITHAQLEEIENCGHWTVVEKPDIINDLATEFFSEN